MFAKAREAVDKARALLWAGALAGLFTLLTYFVPALEMPPVEALGIAALSTACRLGLSTLLRTDALRCRHSDRAAGQRELGIGCAGGLGAARTLGAGERLGPGRDHELHGRSARMVAVGRASPSWFPRRSLPWPSAGGRSCEPSAAARTRVRARRATSASRSHGGRSGLALAAAGTVIVAWRLFDIPPHLTLVALALSFALAAVAVRSTGETDINPVGRDGARSRSSSTAGWHRAVSGPNLMAAAVTGAGASQAADMMQDLKTGRLLGASPRRQFVAQVMGYRGGASCFAFRRTC